MVTSETYFDQLNNEFFEEFKWYKSMICKKNISAVVEGCGRDCKAWFSYAADVSAK